MRSFRRLYLPILIAVALILSAPSNGSASTAQNQSDNKDRTNATSQRSENQQLVFVPSPVFQAAVLQALRAIVDEEVARQKQEHSDYKRWNTPAFWFGDVGLVVVGFLYTVFAGWQLLILRRQNEMFMLSQRAQVILGRPDGVIMELVPPRVGEPLKVKIFFLNAGSITAEQFFAQTSVGYRSGKSFEMPEGHSLEAVPWRKWERGRGDMAKFVGRFAWSTSQIGARNILVQIATSREKMTQDDIDNLLVSFSGKFQYFDGFGQPEYRTFSAHYAGEIAGFIANEGPFPGGPLDRRKPGFGMYSIAPEK